MPLYSFPDIKSALHFWSAGCTTSCLPSYVILNGKWRFHLAATPFTVPQRFYERDFTCDNWDTIRVPANWECEGFDRPIYTNMFYPFPLDPPRARRRGAWSSKSNHSASATCGDSSILKAWKWTADVSVSRELENPTGCYRQTFELPVSWISDDRRVFVVFEGVDSAFYCWINGKFVGYSQDSRLPAEFDVTEYLLPGTNLLAAQVMRWSDGSYLEDQDHWWLSGIHRDVVLYVKEPTFIADYVVSTNVPEGSVGSALVVADVFVHEAVTADVSLPSDVDLDVQLYDANRKLVADATTDSSDLELCDPGEVHGQPFEKSPPYFIRKVSVKLEIPTAHLWTAETPYLYTLVMRTLSPLGRSIDQNGPKMKVISDVEACRVGVRTVKIFGQRLRVNQEPIIIQGVNRHEHCPKHGKAVTKQSMLQDVIMMKRYNFNAVRTSHYPNHPRFYDLCDEHGLYVCDEANMETHGFNVGLHPTPFLSNDPRWRLAHIARVARMIQRDRNHASIIMWSLGNEAGCGGGQHAMATWARLNDSTRPLHYESGGSRTTCTDIICPMYARVRTCEYMAAETCAQGRPVILCEYSHAMGNSNGNVNKYWDCFRKEGAVQGGFVWDWVDQGLDSVSHDGQRFWAYGGDFGDQPNDAQFCINGLVFPDRRPHPATEELKFLMRPVTFHLTMSSETAPYSDVDVYGTETHTTGRDLDPWEWKAPRLIVRNWLNFSTLNGLQTSWTIMADSGTMLSAGDLSLPVIPAGCVLNFPWLSYFPKLSELALAALRCYHSSRIAPLRELYLELRTIIQRPTSWCDGGHEVACTQLTLPMPFGGFLPGPKIMKSLPTKFPTLRVHESSEGLLQVQSAAGMDLTFYLTGKLNGTVRSAFDRGLPILVGGPVPCFWRAPTDNDRGGEDISYCSRWRRAGMDRLRMVSYLFLQVLDSELVSSLDDITFIYISFVIDNTHRLALARQNELMDQVRLAQSGCQLHIVLIQEEITAMTLLEFLLSLLMLCTRQAQYLSS